jgi:catechol 2,3-dioxygenase-like lactoylglutathione lyase family enzyme
MKPTSFDHVALWVAERDAHADLLCSHFGMHVIDRTDTFTLVGADARQGKVTLFDEQGPRDPGVLGPIVFRVSDLDAAAARLPDELDASSEDGTVTVAGPEGVRYGLVGGARDLEYDLDHVVLRVTDPEATAEGLVGLGFEQRDGALWVADRSVRLAAGGADDGERPLLNHLALLVDSANDHLDEARSRGLEIDDVKDAANTLAVFVRGPEGIRVEYVEHKPTFSLT